MVDDDGRTYEGRTEDGRTPAHGHPISSPCEPNGSGELKIHPVPHHIPYMPPDSEFNYNFNQALRK